MIKKYMLLMVAFTRAFYILWVKFPNLEQHEKLAEIKSWSKFTLDILEVKLAVTGTSAFDSTLNVPHLLVSNHISWLDILVIQSIHPSLFVAKSDVQSWPVIGLIAKGCGVIFVERGSTIAARRMVEDISIALKNGYSVAGFPEGTSTLGVDVQLFHANLFEAAVACQSNVLPLALRYTGNGTTTLCEEAAFVGDINFLQSLHQVVRLNGLTARLYSGEPISSAGHTRRTIAHLSHVVVTNYLTSLGRVVERSGHQEMTNEPNKIAMTAGSTDAVI